MKTRFPFFFIGCLTWMASLPAWSFSHLECSTKLDKWKIEAKRDDQFTSVATGDSSFRLPEDQSSVMQVRDEKNSLVATVFPWNTLHVREEGKSKKIYLVQKNETPAFFKIDWTEKKNRKLIRSLECQMTF